MLKALLLFLSHAGWARTIVTRWRFARRAATRFVAGETLEDALRAFRALERRGLMATLCQLGEHVSSEAEAHAATVDYLRVLDRICTAAVRANASLKLTELGLAIDWEMCKENLSQVVTKAAECGIFIRIDMEDSSTVDRTLEIYRALRAGGLANVGLVIQAYLYRSQDDMRALLSEGARIRLCKGAYQETPKVAFPKKADVDRNYDRLAGMMIEAAVRQGGEPTSADGRIPAPPAFATHDPQRITFARNFAEQAGLSKRGLEFQMLYGIRGDLQQALANEGYPVRVYVPYGTEWYPYYVRRLAERPANLWFFLSNILRG